MTDKSRIKTAIGARKSSAVFPVVSNLLLILCTAMLLWLASSIYHERIREVSLNENRFLTTEWHLLQELKEQTDQQLTEKDREIADLRRQYSQLQLHAQSPRELEELQAKLRQAEAERQEIFTQRLEVVPLTAEEESSTTDEPPAKSKASQSNTEMTTLLREHIKTLQTQLEESNVHTEVLQKEINTLREANEELEEKYGRVTASNRQQISRLYEQTAGARRTAEAAIRTLEQRIQNSERMKETDIDALNTRSLLRAIISSPAIRSEYPDLL